MDGLVWHGRTFVAILHDGGVDVVSTDYGKVDELVQSLPVPLATRIAFCQRTGLLSVLEEGILRIYSHESLNEFCAPVWREWKAILIPMRCLSGGILISTSFSYPVYSIFIRGMMTLINVDTTQFQSVNDACDISAVVTGGTLSYQAGFTATAELAATRSTWQLRVGDISDLFEPLDQGSAALSMLSTTSLAPIGSTGSSSCTHEDISLNWRPALSGDAEMLLTVCKSGIAKVWVVRHGQEHEEVTAAMNAAVSAGLRAERGPSLCATAAPEVHLVADLSSLFVNIGLVSLQPHLAWTQSVVMDANEARAFSDKLPVLLLPDGAAPAPAPASAPSRPSALHSSDLWLALTLAPHEHPLSPAWVCQLVCLHPKGRYHQYEPVLHGDSVAFKVPVEGCLDGQQRARLLGAFFACRFVEAFPDRPVCLTMVAQFREQCDEAGAAWSLAPKHLQERACSRDKATLGLVMVAAKEGSFCLESSFSLLHHCRVRDAPPAMQGRGFIPLQAEGSAPATRGSGLLYAAARDGPAAGDVDMLGALASYSAQRRPLLASSDGSSPRLVRPERCPLMRPLLTRGGVSRCWSAPPPAPDDHSHDGCRVMRSLLVSAAEVQSPPGRDSSPMLVLLTRSRSSHGAQLLVYSQQGQGHGMRRTSPMASPETAGGSTPTPGVPRSPSTDAAPTMLSRASYSVSIVPDRQNGLGIRLATRDGAVVIDSFKRNADDKPLAAEGSGIEVGDELLAVRDTPLEGLSLHDVIEAVRSVVLGSIGQPLLLTLRQPESDEAGQSASSVRSPSPLSGRQSGSGHVASSIASVELAKMIYPGPGEWRRVGCAELEGLGDSENGADLCVSEGAVMLATLQGQSVVVSRVLCSLPARGEDGAVHLLEQCRVAWPDNLGSAAGAVLQLWPVGHACLASLLLAMGEGPERPPSREYNKECLFTLPLALLHLQPTSAPSSSAATKCISASTWEGHWDGVVRLQGYVDPQHRAKPWALLACPLDGPELLLRPLVSGASIEAETSVALYTAHIQSDECGAAAAEEEEAASLPTLVGSLNALATVHTAPFGLRYSGDNPVDPKALFIGSLEGVMWVSPHVFKLIGAPGSITFKRQAKEDGWLGKDGLQRVPQEVEGSVWRAAMQEMVGGGVGSTLAAPTSLSASALHSDLMTSTQVHAPLYDPVLFLARLFGSLELPDARSGALPPALPSGLALDCIDGFVSSLCSPSPDALSNLSHTLHLHLQPAPSSSSSSPVPLPPALLQALGLDKTLLLKAVVDALASLWRAAVGAAAPSSSLSRDVQRAFAARDMDTHAASACVLSSLLCALDAARQAIAEQEESNRVRPRSFVQLSEGLGEDAETEARLDVPPAAARASGPHMSASVAVCAMQSRSQGALVQAFLLDPVAAHFQQNDEDGSIPDATDRPSLTGRRPEHYTVSSAPNEQSSGDAVAPWSQSGQGRGGVGGAAKVLDALHLVSSTHAALWLHDPSPLAELVGSCALRQFRQHKDSMHIFLDLVVAGSLDKLIQLARVDRHSTGQQLLSLLQQDLKSDRGRQVLKKNAFALMRLKRYKHAAAAFLCAEPPMVKEACGVLAQQAADPLFAFLVARVVEHRTAAAAASALGGSVPVMYRGGFVLGPVSRDLLKTYLIPDFSSEAAGRGTGIPYPIRAGDAKVLLLLCSLWAQERSAMHAALSLCLTRGIWAPSLAPDDGLSRLLSVFPTFSWCLQLRPALVPAGCLAGLYTALDAVLSAHCLPEAQLQSYASFLARARAGGGAGGAEQGAASAFDLACRAALDHWRAHMAASAAAAAAAVSADDAEALPSAAAAVASSSAVNSASAAAPPPAADEIDDDVRRAQERLQRLQQRERLQREKEEQELLQQQQEDSAGSGGVRSGGLFNLAYEPKAAAPAQAYAAPKSIFDAFDVPAPRKPAPTPAAPPKSIFDAFDVPAPAPARKPSAPPRNMLDMFDMPPAPRAAPALPAPPQKEEGDEEEDEEDDGL